MIAIKAKIDTIQFKTEKINTASNKFSKDEPLSRTSERDEYITLKAQVGKVVGYTKDTYKYSLFKNTFQKLINENLLIDCKEVNRLDVCFDYNQKYKQMLRINNFIQLLYAVEIGAKVNDAIEIRRTLDKKITNLIVRNAGDTKELSIYDKTRVVDEPQNFCKTRQEFRFKRLKNADTDKVIDNLIELLPNLINYYEQVEQLKIEHLAKLYKEELAERKVNNLSSFVCRYQEDILTRNICKELYARAGFKGNFNRWLYKFIKDNTKLKFIDRQDVEHTLKQMQEQLIEYKNS